ncbi:MAG: hypothetical protein F6K65_01890 [Moorea sp. SIO3C2]|nr:hypothetical protein [Moorena sp. SIO3C2]
MTNAELIEALIDAKELRKLADQFESEAIKLNKSNNNKKARLQKAEEYRIKAQELEESVQQYYNKDQDLMSEVIKFVDLISRCKNKKNLGDACKNLQELVKRFSLQNSENQHLQDALRNCGFDQGKRKKK